MTKGPIGTKGPRTTTNLSIPGRYLILTPYSDGCGISRKIEDPQERKRLKQLINELTIPEGMGVIVRTAGEGKKPRYFVRDLHLLLKKWEEITRKMQSERAPCCLYMEPDLVERTVRDFLTEDVDRVLIDNKADYDRTQDLVGLISKRSRSKIAHYTDSIPIFERFNIERQIELTGQRKVPLPSGGEIVIDETEALIAIDVNTGSHKNRSGDEKNTLYAVNLEAAQEAARQIRLRNLGGLIILDFIDMKERRHRNAVYEKMVELMSSDKAKNHILPISQLGIMQMTRQRQQESLSSNLYTDCPYCRGRGHREVRHDHVGRAPAAPLVRRPAPAGPQGRQGVLAARARASVGPRAAPQRGRRPPRAHGEELRRPARLPRRPELPHRELQDHQRHHRGRVSVGCCTGLAIPRGWRS